MPRPFIRFEGVSYSYGAGGKALDGVSFTVHEGEFVAVVGANGSGKSTMARLCNGLLTPEQGRVTVGSIVVDPDGCDPETLWELRRHVGMVFQNPDNQLVAATVEEDVAFGPENMGLPPVEIRRRVAEALEAVGLEEMRLRAPHQLSGGQKQLVAIAGVLALEPRCIVLDEATSMLDPRSASAVMETIGRLHRERGLTVLHITHDMEEVAWAQRVFVLHRGRVVAAVTPPELFLRVRSFPEWGLDVPSTVRLAEGLRARGWPIPPFAGRADELVDAVWRFALRGLTYTYHIGTLRAAVALQDVDIHVPNGSFTVLIGHVGSGKSTLLQHFNGLIRPQRGWVDVLGIDVGRASPAELRRLRERVGLVLQQPERQLFADTVADDVAFGPRQMGLDPMEVDRRVEWALETVGLPGNIASRSPFSLSGGERRRAAIAGVLAMKPEVLVMDEPVAGLDPAGRRDILDVVLRWHRGGKTVVLATHHMDIAASYADQVVVLKKGRVWLTGTPRDVFGRYDLLQEAGVAVPPVTRVLTMLRDRGLPVRTDCLTVDEAVAEISRFRREGTEPERRRMTDATGGGGRLS